MSPTAEQPRNTDPNQELLQHLKELLDETPQTQARARIAGVYAVNFCKKPPLGYDPKLPDPQNQLTNLQINTINQIVADIDKPLEITVEAPNKKGIKLTVLQFHSFDEEKNVWTIWGSDGKNVGMANVSAEDFSQEIKLAE